MNARTEALTTNYKPRLAVIVFSGGDTSRDYYLESHEINDQGQLLEGKPLMQETLDDIVDEFFDERKNSSAISGIIPISLLQYDVLPGGHYNMTWYRPAEKRHMFFAEKLHIPSGPAWVPALLYHVEKKTLSVFALATDQRPYPDSKQWQAPFHNVYADGTVCLGSAKVEKPSKRTYESLMKYWEDLFWLSEFTHLAGNENPTKSNLNTIWNKLIGTETRWSEMDELVQIKATLKDIL